MPPLSPTHTHTQGWSPPVPPNRAGATPQVGAGRFVSTARALGALIVIVATSLFCLGASGNLIEESPGREIPASLAVGLTFLAFWLGGGLWLGLRVGWGWAITYWLAWGITLPVYVYQSARAGGTLPRPRFPTAWSFGGIAVAAVLLFTWGVAFPTTPLAQQVADVTARSRIVTAEGGDTRTASPTTSIATQEPTATPEPAAIYEPSKVVRLLMEEPVLAEENPGIEPCTFEERGDPTYGGPAEVVQACDWGTISYLVMDTSEVAEDYVTYNRSSRAFPLTGHPDYATDIYLGDDYADFMAAVGNVVVIGTTTDDEVSQSGWATDEVEETEVYAAALATFGVDRLLRLAGEPSDRPGSGPRL